MPIPQVGFILILSNLTDNFHHRNPAATPLLTSQSPVLSLGQREQASLGLLDPQVEEAELTPGDESPLTMYLRGESKIEKLGKFQDPYLVGCWSVYA